MTDERKITERWRDDRRIYRETVERSVELENAPDITGGGVQYSPQVVSFSFVRSSPTAAWQPRVTIYASRRRTPTSTDLVRTPLALEKVHQPEQWLADLVARATPDAVEAP